MKLQTKISLKPEQNQLDYKSQLLILGSCFAENMGGKLDYFKFQNLQNPFGILFHPQAIEKLISKAKRLERYSADDCFFLNERWHCFDAHSDLSDLSQEKLLETLNAALEKTQQQLRKSTHMIITLGTAWVYRKSGSNEVVANCHKVPGKEFSKELLSIDSIQKSMQNTLQNVLSINKNIQFIFTVSPVRHLKDCFVANQRSKAHLIAALHQVIENSDFRACTAYFPSYEILMDELRDYRFYDADMVHPNQVAIDYIWGKFAEVWISADARSSMEKVAAVQKALQHRSFNAGSVQHLAFLTALEKKITYLQQEFPHMIFSE